MIRLATVFSGIGAIEHALQRMGINSKIVFACDNGDVDILSKKIENDLDAIETELLSLTKLIFEVEVEDKADNLYKTELQKFLEKCSISFSCIIDSFSKMEMTSVCDAFFSIIKNILLMPNVTPAKVKEYSVLKRDIESTSADAKIVSISS